MRKVNIYPGGYFHIFNRQNEKKSIFSGDDDYVRFLFLILYFQSATIFSNIDRQVSFFNKNYKFKVPQVDLAKVVENKSVELVNFVLMPNHFHLLIKEIEEGGISRYMHRIQVSYTKYFNLKNKKSGHLFQGPYKAVHLEDNDQLLYLSTYIHKNPSELKKWKGKEDLYPWSSYRDIVGNNRWGSLLEPKIILDQFKSSKEYKVFVNSSVAKEFNL